MILLSGKELRLPLREEILKDENYQKLHFYLYSDKDNIACFYYLKGIKKVLDDLSIPYDEDFYQKEKTWEENLSVFKASSSGKQVILARPLGTPKEKEFIDSIDSRFDPDMMSDVNKGKLYSGNLDYLPATARSVKTILDAYSLSLSGKKCLILGRSNTVGLPVFELVQRYQGLAVLSHSKIPFDLLVKEAKDSDFVFLCTGKEGLLPKDCFHSNQVVIDCGFSKNGGDLGFVPEEGSLQAYTPVPGGVGALTSLCLVLNALTLLKN